MTNGFFADRHVEECGSGNSMTLEVVRHGEYHGLGNDGMGNGGTWGIMGSGNSCEAVNRAVKA